MSHSSAVSYSPLVFYSIREYHGSDSTFTRLRLFQYRALQSLPCYLHMIFYLSICEISRAKDDGARPATSCTRAESLELRLPSKSLEHPSHTWSQTSLHPQTLHATMFTHKCAEATKSRDGVCLGRSLYINSCLVQRVAPNGNRRFVLLSTMRVLRMQLKVSASTEERRSRQRLWPPACQRRRHTWHLLSPVQALLQTHQILRGA